VHVHRAGLQPGGPDPPHPAEQLLAGHRPLLVAHQVLQQRRLGLGQVDPRPVLPPDLAALQVDGAGPELHQPDLRRLAERPPQHRLDPCQQFLRRERLDHVVVGAHLQPADAVVLGAAGGQDDDRPGRARPPQVGEHLQPVAPGKQEVEQHEVDAVGRGLPQSDGAVGRLGDVVAAQAQGVGHPAADRRLVLDHDDTGFRHGFTHGSVTIGRLPVNIMLARSTNN
jgi:hypothetical protein